MVKTFNATFNTLLFEYKPGLFKCIIPKKGMQPPTCWWLCNYMGRSGRVANLRCWRTHLWIKNRDALTLWWTLIMVVMSVAALYRFFGRCKDIATHLHLPIHRINTSIKLFKRIPHLRTKQFKYIIHNVVLFPCIILNILSLVYLHYIPTFASSYELHSVP